MNHIDLSSRVAIVTGGAGGIGRGVARRFLASNAQVVLWDLDESALAEARKDLEEPARVFIYAVDVTNAVQVESAVKESLQAFGRIDVLVNGAGITGGNATLWELEPSVWKSVIDVNLYGSYLCCRSVVPHMISRGWGRIVNIASVAGKDGNPNASHYSASKAGLIALTKSLGKELATSGVLVNAVTPAAARTPIFESMSAQHIEFMLSKIPMGRFVLVEEIAAMIAWLCSDECSFSTGAVFDLSGGRATY